MTICEFVIQHDRYGVVFLSQPVMQATYLVLRHLQARPSVPLELGCLGHTTQAADQATRRHTKAEIPLIVALDGYRESVRNEEKTTLRLLLLI